MVIRIKRIYEPAAKSDGVRILVDRIWPRGISLHDARIASWEKDVAPTSELRKWFGHSPDRWQKFRQRYRAELKLNPVATDLRKFAQRRVVTLVYAAHDQKHNHALVLLAFLRLPTVKRAAVTRARSSKRTRKP